MSQATYPELLTHARELHTMVPSLKKSGRHPSEEDLGTVLDAAMVMSPPRGVAKVQNILWIGKTSELPKKYLRLKNRNLQQRHSVTPGLVDCHNHLVFSGDRADEFAQRCAGASYVDIANRGGGIRKTVRETTSVSLSRLLALARTRIRQAYGLGVRQMEIKSGYGLTLETETKQLEVIQQCKRDFPQMKIHATYLGPHSVPEGMSKSKYLQEVIDLHLPSLHKKRLIDSCDIFIDEGYFTIEDGRQYCRKAKELGLAIRIHADELTNTGAAQLGIQQKALSVDHLLKIDHLSIQSLSKSNTVGVLLPVTAFYLKAPYAPARALIDAGARVALATDFNPGSAMCNSLPFALTLGALYMGMTRSELLTAVTVNAAQALGDQNSGALLVGKQALYTITRTPLFEGLYYEIAG